jgi:hypothetical protein
VVIAQYASCIDNLLRGTMGDRGVVLGNEVKEPIQISESARAERDGRNGRCLPSAAGARLA